VITLDHFPQLLAHYGSLALFILLALGIVGLPIPEETLLVTVGFLLSKGKLSFISVLPAAYLGGMCGISLSYLLGRTAGSFLVKKYGYWLGITPVRMEKAHLWFQRIGVWSLFIGYFIPGVRHFTGYVAGTLRVNFKKFALFAYGGEMVWASLFLALGYWLEGSQLMNSLRAYFF
jgi:membrane protein DedA with SNARE-associated domain